MMGPGNFGCMSLQQALGILQRPGWEQSLQQLFITVQALVVVAQDVHRVGAAVQQQETKNAAIIQTLQALYQQLLAQKESSQKEIQELKSKVASLEQAISKQGSPRSSDQDNQESPTSDLHVANPDQTIQSEGRQRGSNFAGKLLYTASGPVGSSPCADVELQIAALGSKEQVADAAGAAIHLSADLQVANTSDIATWTNADGQQQSPTEGVKSQCDNLVYFSAKQQPGEGEAVANEPGCSVNGGNAAFKLLLQSKPQQLNGQQSPQPCVHNHKPIPQELRHDEAQTQGGQPVAVAAALQDGQQSQQQPQQFVVHTAGARGTSREDQPRSDVTKQHTTTQDDLSNLCGMDDVDDTVCVGEEDDLALSDMDEDEADDAMGDDATVVEGDDPRQTSQPGPSPPPSQYVASGTTRGERSEGRARSRSRTSRLSSAMRRSSSMHHLGKKLNFAELQRNFGVGLKQAAQQLGVCPTTLKRACRRHGIQRWPARQVVKLTKLLQEAGYKGPDLIAVRDLTLTRHFQALHKRGVKGLGNLKDIGDLHPLVPPHVQERPFPAVVAKQSLRKSAPDFGSLNGLPLFPPQPSLLQQEAPENLIKVHRCPGSAMSLPPAAEGPSPTAMDAFLGFAPKPEVDSQITSAPATDNSPGDRGMDPHLGSLLGVGDNGTGSMQGVLRPLDDPWADRWLDDMINEAHPWLEEEHAPLV